MGQQVARSAGLTMLNSLVEKTRNSPLCAPTVSPATGVQVNEHRTIHAAAVETEGESCEFGSAKYFALCGLGGVLSCGITHTAVMPLDLVKCRLQVDSAKYQNLAKGFKISVAEEGVRSLAKG